MELKDRKPSDVLVLGSWHVYNRLTLDEGIALVKGAMFSQSSPRHCRTSMSSITGIAEYLQL